MPQIPPKEQPNRLRTHLKFLISAIVFTFSLGVGYQKIESRIDAADTATNARISAHELQVEVDREYIKQDLAEIKTKLDEIERYLREKK